jgi:serine/threonine protein kinase
LYEQGEQLGKGKFGVVYECTPRHDPTKRCAVKGKSIVVVVSF